MKPFIMVWNSAQLDVWQQDLLNFLDAQPVIKNWFVPFLGTILLIADETQNASTLSNLIHARYPNMLLGITPTDQYATNGWMPQTFWDLIREPKSSGRWPDAPPKGSYLEAFKTLADLYGKQPQPRQKPASVGELLESLKKQK